MMSQRRAFTEMEALVVRNCASDDEALFSVANWRSFRLHYPTWRLHSPPRGPRDGAMPAV